MGGRIGICGGSLAALSFSWRLFRRGLASRIFHRFFGSCLLRRGALGFGRIGDRCERYGCERTGDQREGRDPGGSGGDEYEVQDKKAASEDDQRAFPREERIVPETVEQAEQ